MPSSRNQRPKAERATQFRVTRKVEMAGIEYHPPMGTRVRKQNAPPSSGWRAKWRWRESNTIPPWGPAFESRTRHPVQGDAQSGDGGNRIPSPHGDPRPKAERATQFRVTRKVEMAGIEPASERFDPRKSTSVAGRRWSPQASRPARTACGQPLCLLHG